MVFKKGHKINLGKKNPKASETKKRLYKEGILKSWNKGKKLHYNVWNKGLTKETNKILKNTGKKISKKAKERLKDPTKNAMYGKKHTEKTKLKMSQNEGRANKISKAKKKLYEDPTKNPNWKGGLSFEPYGQEFNNQLKEKIRKRDNYECQECRKKQIQLKIKLDVHHIDYNKKNNSKINLISLCRKCHVSTNKNRKHWTRYFQMQMFIRELFDPENLLIFNEDKQLIALEKF